MGRVTSSLLTGTTLQLVGSRWPPDPALQLSLGPCEKKAPPTATPLGAGPFSPEASLPGVFSKKGASLGKPCSPCPLAELLN